MTGSISNRAKRAALAAVFAEPVWLAEHLTDPDIRVVEVDVSRAAYQQGPRSQTLLYKQAVKSF